MAADCLTLLTMTSRALAIVTLAAFIIAGALAQTAPDPTTGAAVPVTSSEYKFPAGLDPHVPSTLPTELWARVYRPAALTGNAYPLLVFLHGNHATCGRDAGAGQGRFDVDVQYTFTGTCPPGYVPVPNHEGYAYLANRLAGFGYVVVSINANRGVNAAPGVAGDRGLNLRRGALVLRHLELLSQWNHGAGPDHPLRSILNGKLDFTQVGLLGHSRGGEGARAAYNLYRDAGSPWPGWIADPVAFRGIFEIGPVDGQTDRILNADGTAWTVLLPMCDGDVANLQGVRPFDRMLSNRQDLPATMKATFTVWGANHNFYNTEWQTSDSAGCLGHRRLFPQLIGSPEQRTTSYYSVLAFFRGNVGSGANPQLNQLFHPRYGLPDPLAKVTRIDRGFSDSPSPAVTQVFDDFAAGATQNTLSNTAVNYGGIANHSSVQRTAQVSWNAPGPQTYFQVDWKGAGAGLNLAGYPTLEFRVARQCKDAACQQSNLGFPFDVNFTIRLVRGDGTLTDGISLRDAINLTGPVGGLTRFASNLYHPILQTVRVPFSAFGAIATLKAVRFVFDDTRRDDIFLANLRVSSVEAGGGVLSSAVAPATGDSILDPGSEPDNNKLKAPKKSASIPELGGAAGVEIELSSNRMFLPQGELLVLKVGAAEFSLSRYPAGGDTGTVIFSLTAQEYDALADGAPVSVQYGAGDLKGWNFGRLNKGQAK